MDGLYKKITKGIYPKICNNYSHDLVNLISMLLKVDPMMRPSCGNKDYLTNLLIR